MAQITLTNNMGFFEGTFSDGKFVSIELGNPTIHDAFRLNSSQENLDAFIMSSLNQIDNGDGTFTYTNATGTPTYTINYDGTTATIDDLLGESASTEGVIDTKMGDAYYEQDLTTGVKKYFQEAVKFDGSQFVMDGDRVVGLKDSFIDSLAADLTNIVNTSITTATLTADVASITNTLTALGINADLIKTKDLRMIDSEGHEHKIHLGN